MDSSGIRVAGESLVSVASGEVTVVHFGAEGGVGGSLTSSPSSLLCSHVWKGEEGCVSAPYTAAGGLELLVLPLLL